MGRGRRQGCWSAAERRDGSTTRRGPYRWTTETLEQELRAFGGAGREFPTLVELDAAGRSDLRAAVTVYGGCTRWAARLGLPLPTTRLRQPYSEDEMREEARRIVVALGRLPGERALRQLGHPRLATAVRHAGGARAFCARHGLLP
jgi:hypothetical protein